MSKSLAIFVILTYSKLPNGGIGMKIHSFLEIFLLIFVFTEYSYSQAWVPAGSVPTPGMQPTISVNDWDVAWIAGGRC